MGAKAQEATPESATAAGRQAIGAARERPVPAAIAGAFVAGFAIAWLLRR